LREADVAEADLILVMTSGHREAIQAEFPAVAGRVHLLSQMAGRAYDIPDPYGGTPGDYDASADEIHGLIEAGMARIIELASVASRARAAQDTAGRSA
jgi:protein-tyrosine phosphatase